MSNVISKSNQDIEHVLGVNVKLVRNSDKCIPLSKSDPNDSRPD
jgi:hypothetical protein